MRHSRRALSLLLAVVLLGVAPATEALAAERRTLDIRFPTVSSAWYSNDYRAARSGGRTHAATDLFAPRGAPVYAAHAGRVVWRPKSEHATAGFALWVRDRRGRTFAYYHLGRAGGRRASAIAGGLREGSRVRRGQIIGRVGDSGNAAGGTPHLHFEIHDPTIADPWAGNRRNPYWSLLRAQGRRVPRSLRVSRSGATASRLSILRRGSRGPGVTVWQRNLNRVQHSGLATDGIFGPNTHRATVRFQRSAGLGPQGLGQVGPKSRAAMARRLANRAPARRSSPAATASGGLLRRGSRGASVAAWQRNLNRVQHSGLTTDGVFGSNTHRATVRFQRSAGLGPQGLGIVGPKSRAAMARRLR